MGAWLTELRRNLPADIVLHIVGTKSDVVAREPHRREVPFERCIAYVAENLAPGTGATPPPTAGGTISGASSSIHAPPGGGGSSGGGGGGASNMGGGAGAGGTGSHTNNGFFFSSSESPSAEQRSPTSKRSSGFWGQEAGWDACHEISAESGEGVEEVFRVVTRKLVEQNRKIQAAMLAAVMTPGAGPAATPGGRYYDGAAAGTTDGSASGYGYDGAGHGGPGGYFDGARPGGSFRVGRDRRSWLFSPGFSPSVTVERGALGAGQQQLQQREEEDGRRGRKNNKCC